MTCRIARLINLLTTIQSAIEDFAHSVVCKISLTDLQSTRAECLPKLGIVCQSMHSVGEAALSLNHLSNAGILVGPAHGGTITRTVDHERHTDCRAICELARKRQLHVASVGRVERHRNEQRVRFFTQAR